MILQPDFYAAFRCLAGGCRHSCCRGWEIDVDEAAYAYYLDLPGKTGEVIRASIETDADGAHFRLTPEERCPHLRADGLCEIICQLGEDALCDICALHPRFFTALGEHEIQGLGLSCEAVCDLLLRSDAPLCLVDETGARHTVSALLNLSPERLRFDGAPPSEACLARMARTEPIDDRWAPELHRLCADLPSCPPLPTGARYDRILQYLLLRQLDRLPAVPLDTLITYARENTAFIAAQDALYGTDAEHLRRWSEQMEYSTENVDILLDEKQCADAHCF